MPIDFEDRRFTSSNAPEDSMLCQKYQGLLLSNVNYAVLRNNEAFGHKSQLKEDLDHHIASMPHYKFPSYPTRCYPTIADYRKNHLVCAIQHNQNNPKVKDEKASAPAPKPTPAPKPVAAPAPKPAAAPKPALTPKPAITTEPAAVSVKPKDIIIPAFKDAASLKVFVKDHSDLADSTVVTLKKKDGSLQQKTYGALKQKLAKLLAKKKSAKQAKPTSPKGPITINTFKNVDQLEVFVKDGLAKGYSDSLVVNLTKEGKPTKQKTFGGLKEKYNKMKKK